MVAVSNAVISAGFGSDVSALQEQVSTLQSQLESLEETGIEQNGQPIDLSHLTVERLTVNADVFIGGAVIVEGPAEFRGTAFFDQIVTFGDSLLVEGDALFRGTATFNNNSAGFAIIEAGASSVHVSFTEPFDQLPIVTVSLGGGKFATYSYNNVTTTGFDIVLQTPAIERLEFTWTSSSVEAPNTFVQQ